MKKIPIVLVSILVILGMFSCGTATKYQITDTKYKITDFSRPITAEEIKSLGCTQMKPSDVLKEIFKKTKESKWELQLTFSSTQGVVQVEPPDDIIAVMKIIPGSPFKVCIKNRQRCDDQSGALGFCPEQDLVYIRFWNLAVQGSCSGCGILLLGEILYKEGDIILELTGEAFDCWKYEFPRGKFSVFGRAFLRK